METLYFPPILSKDTCMLLDLSIALSIRFKTIHGARDDGKPDDVAQQWGSFFEASVQVCIPRSLELP